MTKIRHGAVKDDTGNEPKNRELPPAGMKDEKPDTDFHNVPGKEERVNGVTVYYADNCRPVDINKRPKQQPPTASEKPTTTELALVAASLRRGEPQKWSDLASDALDL